MFILSFKMPWKKNSDSFKSSAVSGGAAKPKKLKALLIGLISIFAVFLVLIICINSIGSTPDDAVTPAGKQYSLTAGDKKARVEFLKQFGWETDPDSEEQSPVIIPAEFNEVYNDYNEIQVSQGLDLSDYKGEQCVKYTYAVTNYNGEDGAVFANLLVYDGNVIGGDLNSPKLSGFMHGFQKKAEKTAD